MGMLGAVEGKMKSKSENVHKTIGKPYVFEGLGARLKSCWRRLEAVLARFGSVLPSSWGHLGRCWGCLLRS